MEKVLELKKAIENAQKICVFTGAGISCPSGIPDFRSANGLYNEKGDYEYSPEEYADEYKEIEIFKDSNVRHYACVVDKNRAGAKPILLFRINLAYNSWEELGYLRLKQK